MPQITHFIAMLYNNMRRALRFKDILAACHLTENNGTYTLLMKAVLYSQIGSVKYTPLSCNGSIGDKELESQILFHNILF